MRIRRCKLVCPAKLNLYDLLDEGVLLGRDLRHGVAERLELLRVGRGHHVGVLLGNGVPASLDGFCEVVGIGVERLVRP